MLGASTPTYATLCCYCGVHQERRHGPYITGTKLELEPVKVS